MGANTAPHLGLFASASARSCEVAQLPQSRTMSRFCTQKIPKNVVCVPELHRHIQKVSKSHFSLYLMCLKYHGEMALRRKTPLFKVCCHQNFQPTIRKKRGREARPCFLGIAFWLQPWRATDLNAAIFIRAVAFPWSSPRQTHFGSLASDQTNHLSFYFCTWPLLSSPPSAFLPAPDAAPAIGPSAAITAVSPKLSVN